MAKILIVEDDKAINNLIRKNLELALHNCTSLYDGRSAVLELENNYYDLVLLDVMMPGLNGFEVIEKISSNSENSNSENYKNTKTPMIFLTAKSSVLDKVKGLNLGAYDYIVKPFDMLELIARADAVLRRTKKIDNFFILENVKINLDSREVFYDEKLLELTPKEFILLEVLIKNKNIALSREKLLEIAWGYDYMGDTRTVDVHIASLRKKLKWEKIIKTVYKLGYRLEI